MWGPLLEKAFAKLNTCYEFLDGGEAIDAMIDMTGGINESYMLNGKNADGDYKLANSDKIWDVLFKSFCMKSLMGTSIDGNHKSEEINNNELVKGFFLIILKK